MKGRLSMENSILRPLIFLRMEVYDSEENRFNEWYADKHIPHIMNRFPALMAKRFVSTDEKEKTYLTIYEFQNPAKLAETRQILKDHSRPEKKDFDQWAEKCVKKFERFFYLQIFPNSAFNLIQNSHALHTVDLKLIKGLSRKQEEDFNNWYHSDHIPLLLRLFPDFIGTKRYVTAPDSEKQYLTIYGSVEKEQMNAIAADIHRPGREGRDTWNRWEKACVQGIRRGFYIQIYP